MFGDGERGGPEKDPETHSGEASTRAGSGKPGGEGKRNTETTPKLDKGGETGQPQTPAPADDVGVPSDQAIGREQEQTSVEEADSSD